MDARFYGFDDIMKSLGLGTSKALEVWYNKYLQGRETMGLNIDGFTWDEGQIDFTYEFAEIEDTITAMATYLDLNSPALPRGKKTPIEAIKGYIPRQKRFETKGENDFRRELIAMGKIEQGAMLRGESPYSSLREYLAKNLLTTVAEFPDSHAQSLTYQVGQMKSAGALTLTDDNNPGGIVGVTFKAHIPETNVLDKEYWTEDADGNVAAYDETKNPIEDIRKFLNKLLYDGTYGSVHAEIDEDTFYKLIGHPEFKKAIGYMVVNGLFTATTSIEDADKRATEAGANVLLVDGNDTTALVGYFKRLFRGISEVTLHNNVVGVAKFNPETKQFGYPTVKAFNEGVLLFRPVGNIGTIKNVVPLRPDGSAVVAGIFENRGIIEYRYNPETRVQAWESELTVLAVPNRPKKMYRFNLAKKAINGRTAARRTTTSPKAE
ncbi:MAG: hypothetical protein NC209_03895 [Alistipes sp.]|nr:hypothetical protein [Alistipes sp.]